MKKISLLILVFCFTLTACHVPRPMSETESNHELETLVANAARELTMQAILTQLQPSITPITSIPATSTPSFTPEKTSTEAPGFGSISGSILGYPYGDIPRLSVVALSQSSPGTYWYWITGVGNTYYSMDGYVSAGRYQVVAYDSSSHAGGCPSIVEVKNNEMVTCDISNWGGVYPAKPAGVP